MNDHDKAAFTPQDMKVLRLLAVALGSIACVECVVAKNTEMRLLALTLNALTMAICPLTIYGLRRVKSRLAPPSRPPARLE